MERRAVAHLGVRPAGAQLDSDLPPDFPRRDGDGLALLEEQRDLFEVSPPLEEAPLVALVLVAARGERRVVHAEVAHAAARHGGELKEGQLTKRHGALLEALPDDDGATASAAIWIWRTQQLVARVRDVGDDGARVRELAQRRFVRVHALRRLGVRSALAAARDVLGARRRRAHNGKPAVQQHVALRLRRRLDGRALVQEQGHRHGQKVLIVLDRVVRVRRYALVALEDCALQRAWKHVTRSHFASRPQRYGESVLSQTNPNPGQDLWLFGFFLLNLFDCHSSSRSSAKLKACATRLRRPS